MSKRSKQRFKRKSQLALTCLGAAWLTLGSVGWGSAAPRATVLGSPALLTAPGSLSGAPLLSPAPLPQLAPHAQGGELWSVKLPQVWRAPTPLTAASALVVARRAESPLQIAERYNVPLRNLRLELPSGQLASLSRLPEGGLVRVALALGRPSGRQVPGVRRFVVRPGDTLSMVARRFGLSERELISANLELQSLDKVQVGDVLNIPTATRGLLLTVKPGQSAAELIEAYRASPLWTAQVNKFTLPTELRPGDALLLPGIFAASLHEELLARRLRAAQQARAARVLAQYEAFAAWKAERERERQVQYDNFQAWLSSPKRLAEVQKYQRQAAYEAWLAKVAEQQAQEQSQQQAQFKTQLLDLAQHDPRPQMQAAALAAQSAPPLHLLWPLPNPRLTSRFGEQDIDFHQQVFHGGLDMAMPSGTPVHAATSGVVTQSGEGAYGINVYTEDGATTVIYGHLSATAVTVGQVIKPGDLLGYVGCTGECTGPHLHFEIRLKGTPVDPLAFLP